MTGSQLVHGRVVCTQGGGTLHYPVLPRPGTTSGYTTWCSTDVPVHHLVQHRRPWTTWASLTRFWTTWASQTRFWTTLASPDVPGPPWLLLTSLDHLSPANPLLDHIYQRSGPASGSPYTTRPEPCLCRASVGKRVRKWSDSWVILGQKAGLVKIPHLLEG